MIKSILLYFGYAFISSFGLYKIKLSHLTFSTDFLLGGICYASGFLIWLLLLKTHPLSVAFPLAASSLIISTQLFGYFLLGENMSLNKMIGLTIIMIGIVVLFKNS
jgi:multidrug transporter EmrE-like cation transporter